MPERLVTFFLIKRSEPFHLTKNNRNTKEWGVIQATLAK
jgi:hypothetical protein